MDGLDLDPRRCYQALLSRDARFDGRFFTGVRTTGIYCRPVCPARTPRFENVRFYACAAAAEEAGYRPCRRCRPETSPGTPAWLGSSAVVSRALRLIEDGALDDGDTLDSFAARLGIGERQVRRLFTTHLGASPGSIARARRAHFARRLLDETDLPATQVAFAAGFSSIRQFNHQIRRTFDRSPTELRRARGRHRRPGAPADALALRLPFRPPFDMGATLRWMGARATRGVEAVEGDAYRRTVEVDGAPGVIELRPGGANHVVMTAHLPPSAQLGRVVERARRILDLGADPMAVGAHLGADPTLAPLARARPGARVPGAWDPFEVAVRAILGQQISVKAATGLAARVVEAFGKPVEGFEHLGLTHCFPRPEALADADLGQAGTTRAQAGAIRALASAVASGGLTFEASAGLEDLVARLCELPGIGPWTAHYVAMRGCGEPDAFPASDLGLLRAAGERSARALLGRAEAWRPWRAYAAMYLWLSLEER